MRNSIADVALIDVPVVNKAGAALSPYFGDVARGAQNSLEEATMTCVRYWVFSILATAVLSSQSFAQVTFVNLHPAGASGPSQAFGVYNGQQVGQALVGSVVRASLWNGAAASWVDLHPAEASLSNALAIYQGQQVGSATVGGVQRASLWSGTAASWVDLAPAGAENSDARAIHNGQQVGSAFVGGLRASLWTGTAASWVDLHPAGSLNSFANGVYNGQQVGGVDVGGLFTHASLWTGTAASWVDLHPAGASISIANGVFDGRQVGYATIGGVDHASLWSGTAASWVDLSTFLPGSWGRTEADNIWSDGTTISIAGWGRNLTTGRDEALLWTIPVPEPGSMLLMGLGGSVLAVRLRKKSLSRVRQTMDLHSAS